MLATLKTILSQTEENVGTVINLGAGVGSQLTELLKLQPSELVLVEGSKKLYEHLQRKASKHEDIQTVNQWVLPVGNSKGIIYTFNNPRFNSLSPPRDLEQMLPNIKLVEENTENGIAIDLLFASLKLNSDCINVLVLTLQGGEVSILSAIPEICLLDFDYIFIQRPRQGMYEESWRAELSIENFFLITIHEDNSCDAFIYKKNSALINYKKKFERVIIRSEEVASENKVLIDERNSLKLEVEELSIKSTSVETVNLEKQALVSELEDARIEISEFESKFSLQADEMVKKDAEIANLTSDLQIVRAEFQTLKEKYSSMEERLSKMIEERDSEHHWHMENKKWAESLDSAKVKLVDENNKLTCRLTSLEEENGKLVQSYNDSLIREKNIASSLDINTKLMKKLQIDCDDMRRKYEESKTTEAELKQLVTELHKKLQQAAAFYQQLEQQYPELIIEDSE